MFKRIGKAIVIMKACWKVLLLDKELLVFPLLTIVVLGACLAGIAWPIWVNGDLPEFLYVIQENGEETFNNYWIAAIGFAAYFVAFFVMIFFNSALIACVKIRFAGGDPTVMDGLRASVERLSLIFFWALVASVVGFVLNQLRNKKGGPMNFVVGFLGAGWAIATYFVVPVLVSERISPLSAIKRSTSIIKKTWGEALVAEVGFGVFYSITGLVVMACAFAGFSLFESSPTISIFIFVLGALYVLISTLVFTTLDSILKAALYVYAIEGKIPDEFDDDQIKGAFISE